jgi:hypothetical protein
VGKLIDSNEASHMQRSYDGRLTGMGYEVGPQSARAAYEADQAMRDGNLAGIDYKISFNSAASVAREAQRLEQRIEQNRALLRMDEAKEQRDQAHAEVHKDWLPHGNGAPSLQAIAWLEETEREYREAQAALQDQVRNYRATLP